MRRDFALAMLVFVGICLVLWLIGGGIPYGYDGIEIYFTYLVGYNAATFPHVNPLMADIVASPEPAAHPYYYTHHPNLFSHLLSQLLIRLGIADLRWHGLVAIGITAAGLFVGARTLRATVGPAEAIGYLLISSTHYIGVLSWASVLLRSFHFFFFWVAVSLTHAYLSEARRGMRLTAVCVWTYFIFLNDYTLAPFIYLCQLGLVALGAQSWRVTARFAVLTAISGAASVATWLLILAGELGARVVFQDIVYTYLARNAGHAISDVRSMVDFYQQHRIVFWGPNLLVDTTNLYDVLRTAWRHAAGTGHGVLFLLIYALAIYAAVRFLSQTLSRRFSTLLMTRTANGPLVSMVGAMVGAALLLVLSRAVAPKHSWLLDLTHPFRTRGAAFMVGVVALAAALSIASHAKRISLSPLMALTVASVFFGGLSGVQYGTKWTLFSAVSYGTAAAIIVALSFMQTATERLRTRPTLSTFRLDVSLWLAGAVVSLSVLVLFSALSFTSALATMPDRWRHGVRSTLQAGGLCGVGFVLLVVSVLIARHYVTAERFAGFLVKYWPTCLAASALVAAPAAMSGVVADLFRQYQVGLLTLSSVKARALTIILLTLLLAAALGLAVRLYLSVVSRTSQRPVVEGETTLPEWQLTARGDAGGGVTLRSLVVSLLVAIGAMTVLSVGPFTMNFVQTYKPALVFLEDVVLAASAVAGLRWITRMSATSYRRAAATALLMFGGFYWCSYQASLAYRYPPTEIGISRALSSEAFRNASFVEEAMYSAIWYYTRGTSYSVPWALTPRGELDYDALMFFHDRDVKAADYRDPSYFACARQHTEPYFTCERWIRRLKDLGYRLEVGINVLYDEDFMIFQLPTSAATVRAASR